MAARNCITLFAFLLFSCEKIAQKKETPIQTSEPINVTPDVPKTCSAEDRLASYYKLIDISNLNPNIFVNLRYSDTFNFLHTDIYGCIENAYLSDTAATMLNHAQSLLTQKDSSLHLLIWDAVRPRSAQWKMWYAVKMPLEQKVRYVSNPRNGSIHNYGCAVDLTICKTDGTVLDMGTDFDHFGIEANTNNEAYLLQNQMITKEQLQNRVLLRSVMQSVGFRSISSEWWHFNACSRSLAAANYPIVE